MSNKKILRISLRKIKYPNNDNGRKIKMKICDENTMVLFIKLTSLQLVAY